MNPPQRNTVRLSTSDRGLRAANAILKAGGLVALPTETVYGLAADARNDKAVADIYAAKGRPDFNPLIVHVADLAQAQSLVEMSAGAAALAAAFWPGPLTLVLPRRAGAGISEIVAAGLPTLAVRVPDHPQAKALLTTFGGPLAAPSANRSGQISPTTADHVIKGLGGRIDAVLDAGPCPVGLESTIVGFEDGQPVLLRPGGIPTEVLQQAVATPLRTPRQGKISAPGQIRSHYAPKVTLKLGATGDAPLWLAFGPLNERTGLSLSPTADLAEAANHLFAALHEIDKMAQTAGVKTVHVDPIPDTGLGQAINDRLRRAAAPRDQA